MAKFHDVLAALQGIEGDLPGDMWDQLTGAYDEDVAAIGAELNDAAAAKVAQLTNSLNDVTQQLEATKAHNYDLLMSMPAEGGDAESDGEDSADSDSADEGISSLFGDDEKESN